MPRSAANLSSIWGPLEHSYSYTVTGFIQSIPRHPAKAAKHLLIVSEARICCRLVRAGQFRFRIRTSRYALYGERQEADSFISMFL